VLGSLPPGRRWFYEKLLLYAEDTAGGLMNTDFLALDRERTVEDALGVIRSRFRSENYLYVYVTDDHNNLIGVLSFRKLVFAEPTVRLKEIMIPDPVRVSPQTPQEDVAKLVANYDLLAVPVVDENNKLIGVVEVDDIIDVIEEEATEDMYHLANVHSEENVFTPLMRTVRLRVSWVLANLAAAMLGAAAVGIFRETLGQWVWLAVVIPVLATMTANTGTQTLTVVVRALVLGELDVRKGWPVIVKEAGVGVLLGLVSGILLAAGVWAWSGQWVLGVLAGGSLWLSLLLSTLIGALIPLLLSWLKMDPARGTSLLVTTISNIAGFLLLLGLARLLLAGWLPACAGERRDDESGLDRGGRDLRVRVPAVKTFGFQWHLTDRCNLRCAHCYQSDFDARTEKTLEDLREMATRILEALPDRPVSINLTGGEPLLYPQLLPLMEHLHGFANLEELHLITNGTIVAPDLLAALARVSRLRCFKVSLESADPACNDAIRGRGNLARVSANIDLLRQRTGKDVVLMMTLGRYNVASIRGLVDLARERGAAGVIFERFVPLGQGRGLADQALGPRDWREAVAAILAAAGSEAAPDDVLAYHAFWLPAALGAEESLQGALCNLGEESMALMPDGTVYPCRRLPVPVGNALAEPFAGILERLRGYGVASLRPRLTGDLCGWCGVEECAGCRALAQALTGDMLADDPQCLLRLEDS